MKVVINKCWGGFGLSHKAVMRYAQMKGIQLYPFIEKDIKDYKNITYKPYEEGMKTSLGLIYYSTEPLENEKYNDNTWFFENDIDRNDEVLIKVVEELGENANGQFAELKIVEIPDNVDYEIDEYDGMESIHESHRSWG